jgi:hypothetical protein
MFKSLKINTWRQIEKIDIDFHKRLTILTGTNGAGKTTILNILSSHFGWTFRFIGSPFRDEKTGLLKFSSDFWDEFIIDEFIIKANEPIPIRNIIGEITYEDFHVASLSIPPNEQIFEVEVQPKYEIKGLHIPSHRPIYTHQPVDAIPTQTIAKNQAFKTYLDTSRSRYMGHLGSRFPNYEIKRTLLSWIVFGFGSEMMPSSPIIVELYREFEGILRAVLPPKLGFQKLTIEHPEILLVTDSGKFPLDSVSGGIASIIDMAWQVFMYPSENLPFVVTIDEPENHLHPELQQTILPSFLMAFPQAQFIVSTHNPFIISSVLDSNVYVLDFNQNSKVESKILDFINKAGSANEILREVLGLPFTIPKS